MDLGFEWFEYLGSLIYKGFDLGNLPNISQVIKAGLNLSIINKGYFSLQRGNQPIMK